MLSCLFLAESIHFSSFEFGPGKEKIQQARHITRSSLRTNLKESFPEILKSWPDNGAVRQGRVLSTMRKNPTRACPTGIGVRERHTQARIIDVNKNMNAAIPFVAVCIQGQWEHTKKCMSREELLQDQAAGRGPRLRFMKNERSVRHWSNVYAATPEQLTSLTNPSDVHVCLLVGQMDHCGPFAGMFPVGCLVWMAPDFSLPGELFFLA